VGCESGSYPGDHRNLDNAFNVGHKILNFIKVIKRNGYLTIYLSNIPFSGGFFTIGA
jgi:hypothetical protein